MADYLIHVQEELRNEAVVELGAGTGLASIVASFFAKNVVCTGKRERERESIHYSGKYLPHFDFALSALFSAGEFKIGQIQNSQIIHL